MTSAASRPPGVARRTVVGGGAAALAVVLAGCRVRLEDDAPRIPLVPTREPVPDEAFLVGLVSELRGLARDARALGPSSAGLAAQHEQQADVLTQLLRGARVPEATISPAAASPASSPAGTSATAGVTPSGATGTTGTTAPAPVTPRTLGAAEARAVTPAALRSLATLTTPAAAQVRAIAVHRAVAAQGLGARLAWPAPEAPTATGSTTAATDAPSISTDTTGAATPFDPAGPTSATPTEGADSTQAALLAAFREAAYALEVAAARSGPAERTEDGTEDGPAARTPGVARDDAPPSQRALLLADARWAHGRAREIVSRLDAAPAPPVGYPLPSVPTTPQQARALALATFRRLELAVGDRLPDGGEHSTPVVEALTDVVTRGRRWGLPLRAFPGLADPEPVPTATPTAAATVTTASAPSSATGAP